MYRYLTYIKANMYRYIKMYIYSQGEGRYNYIHLWPFLAWVILLSLCTISHSFYLITRLSFFSNVKTSVFMHRPFPRLLRFHAVSFPDERRSSRSRWFMHKFRFLLVRSLLICFPLISSINL